MNNYVPGVCNIGPAEIRVRNRFGWFGLATTLALWAALWLLKVPAGWRLLTFFPASLAATGFLQAAMHFCAGFGMRGLFNFGAEAGKVESVMQAEFRRQDKAKARSIAIYSALIGIAVAAVSFVIP